MSRVCPLCGVDKSILWCDGNVGRKLSTRNLSYNAPSDLTPNVVRCASCGFLFVPHIPQNIDELYAEVNDPEYEKTLDFRKETFRRFLAEKESYVSTKGSLLDIGCYTGLFLEVAQDGGYIVEGVEPCIWARRKAKAKGFTVFSGTLDNMKKKKYYDCITMWDVIEHVKDPVSFVLSAWDHLIDGGCLIMTTPDAGSLLMRLLGRYHWLVSPWHISYFNQKTLKKLWKKQ